MNIIDKVYTYIDSITYDVISNHHIAIAKELLDDGIACMIAGSREQKIRDYAVYARTMAGTGSASIIGLGNYKVSPEKAAMANAMSVHIRDFDDICVSISAHCTASELGVIFAIAQCRRVTGKEALEAYIAGIEAASVLARGFYSAGYAAALDSASTMGIYAAVTAAGKLYQLTEAEWKNALSLAVAEGIGFRANYGTDAKDLTMGRTAEKAIYIVEMAKRGFTANQAVFEDPMGYIKGLQCGFNKKVFEDSIDKRISEFDTPGLVKKFYPTCGSMHTGIDAALEIMKKYRLNVENIRKIVCLAHPKIVEGNLYPMPSNPVEGKFSLPYCLAVAVIHKKVGLSPFEGEKIIDIEVMELLKKIEVKESSQFKDCESKSVQLIVTMQDGSVFKETVMEQTGTPLKPLTNDQKLEKFKECAMASMSFKQIKEIRQMISEMEEIQNMGAFVEQLDNSINY